MRVAISIFLLSHAVLISVCGLLQQRDGSGIGECSNEQVGKFVDEEYPQGCVDPRGNIQTEAFTRSSCNMTCGVPLVNFLCQCGQTGQSIASNFVETCVLNENGISCVDILVSKSLLSMLFAVEHKCIVQNVSSSCTIACSDALNNFKESLGCCVNNLFNVSSSSELDKQYTQYQLWQRCELESPGFCTPLLATKRPENGEATTGMNPSSSTTNFSVSIHNLPSYIIVTFAAVAIHLL